MRIRDRVYWIGSGLLGMNSTDEWDCNIYLLDGGSEQAIIDCGSGYGLTKIMDELQRDGFTMNDVHYILLTHAHMDHAGGAAAMQKLTGAKVGASELTALMVEEGDEEANGLKQAKTKGIYPADCKFTLCKVDLKLKNAMKIKLGDLTLEIIDTPGHSRDMISYYCPEIQTLFCGDNVFFGGQIAALSTPDFSLIQLSQSLTILQELEVESLMPGHLVPVVRNGHEPIRQAVEAFLRDGMPRSIV
jgi:hydroxyacylglutathione hydrolase